MTDTPAQTPAQTPAIAVTPGEGTLQAALDAAAEGAELRLAAGLYTGPFVLERSVRLVAAAGADVILAGAGRGSLLVVQGRQIQVALFGLTLSGGGDTNAGGGVSVPNGARLVLDGCTIRDCTANGYGGGALFLRRGEAHLHRCRFERCSGRSGGAVLLSNDATLRAVDCTFVACEAVHAGAAVAVRDRAVAALIGCDLSGCTAPEVRADDLGWLVDVQVAGLPTTLERCTGVSAPGALVSRGPATLRLVQPR